ncbi:hypothetical protein H0H93_002046 [Arthromyces matolae]|nr:hypothetical protein H0H93_002046 [Arthromyces matolae]
MGGLSNSDLLACLTHVSPTIESLFISSCKIARSSKEEYAIDTAISHMLHLTLLDLSGDLSSDLTISRKPSTPAVEKGGKPTVLRLYQAENSKFLNLKEAVNVTGWGSITITWSYLDGRDRARVDEANEVAMRRGDLIFSASDVVMSNWLVTETW